MFSLNIGDRPVLFSKFFAASDREAVLAAIPMAARRVVFLDTAATGELVATVATLRERDVEVVVRDHHDAPARSNPREVAIADAAARVRELCGDRAVISDRKSHPACSTLVEIGEFVGEGTIVVADNDPDGLTVAMKALGVVYDDLDADAAVLDGARSEQTPERLSPLAMLLCRGLATLPPFNAQRPEISEGAKGKLFATFVEAAEGDIDALQSLEANVKAFEEGVRVAEEIAATATEPAHGVWMVDAVGKGRHDLATLTQRLEARKGCRVTVVRKDQGPIAPKHGGIQISLAVVKAHQAEINLQTLLPAGFVSSPESGIISNTTFLLHLSEQNWNEMVLPALCARG